MHLTYINQSRKKCQRNWSTQNCTQRMCWLQNYQNTMHQTSTICYTHRFLHMVPHYILRHFPRDNSCSLFFLIWLFERQKSEQIRSSHSSVHFPNERTLSQMRQQPKPLSHYKCTTAFYSLQAQDTGARSWSRVRPSEAQQRPLSHQAKGRPRRHAAAHETNTHTHTQQA